MHFMQFMYVHEWFIVFYDEVQSSISQKEENMLENIRITVSQPRLFFWTRIKCVHDLEWHSKEFILFKTTLVSVEWFFPKIHSNDLLPHKVNYTLSLSLSLAHVNYLFEKWILKLKYSNCEFQFISIQNRFKRNLFQLNVGSIKRLVGSLDPLNEININTFWFASEVNSIRKRTHWLGVRCKNNRFDSVLVLNWFPFLPFIGSPNSSMSMLLLVVDQVDNHRVCEMFWKIEVLIVEKWICGQ